MVRMLLLVVVCIGLLPIQMRAQKNSYIIPGGSVEGYGR